MKKPREIRKCPMSYQNLESQWNCGLASYPRCSVSGRRKRKGLSMFQEGWRGQQWQMLQNARD